MGEDELNAWAQSVVVSWLHLTWRDLDGSDGIKVWWENEIQWVCFEITQNHRIDEIGRDLCRSDHLVQCPCQAGSPREHCTEWHPGGF